MEGDKLMIRADADAAMGTGHLLRCLALGQGWKDAGGKVIFITTCTNENLLNCLYAEGFSVYPLNGSYPDFQDLQLTKSLLDQHPKAWLVLDGYHFDSFYHRKAREAGRQLLVIDDMGHLPHYYADRVLNQNLPAHEGLYSSREPYTQLLLGTRYVLLRREFLIWKNWKREIPQVARRILVTLGGSDPDNVTLKVIQAIKLIETPGMEVNIIAGPTNPNMEMIEKELSATPPIFHLRSAPEDMPALMAWADVVVSAAGSTIWELAFMGLPGVLLVVAENQRGAAKKLQEKEVFSVLEFEPQWAPQDLAQLLAPLVQRKHLRQRMSQNARLLVDGWGASRVVQAMLVF